MTQSTTIVFELNVVFDAMVTAWIRWWAWNAIVDYDLGSACYTRQGNVASGPGVESISTCAP